MCKYPKYKVNFSVKANNNLTILRIVREEGLKVDAMSAGEIYAEMAAGFTADEIFFIPNNISKKYEKKNSEALRFWRRRSIIWEIRKNKAGMKKSVFIMN